MYIDEYVLDKIKNMKYVYASTVNYLCHKYQKRVTENTKNFVYEIIRNIWGERFIEKQ